MVVAVAVVVGGIFGHSGSHIGSSSSRSGGGICAAILVVWW